MKKKTVIVYLTSSAQTHKQKQHNVQRITIDYLGNPIWVFIHAVWTKPCQRRYR
jgi:hypothetical protein